jgi:hypothetical protein
VSEEMISFTWPLGDDLDCELCGWSYNEVGLEFWDEKENIWQLYIRVGCYEGDSVMSNDPEWKTKSVNIIEQALMYSMFNEEEANHLRKKIALIKGENE